MRGAGRPRRSGKRFATTGKTRITVPPGMINPAAPAHDDPAAPAARRPSIARGRGAGTSTSRRPASTKSQGELDPHPAEQASRRLEAAHDEPEGLSRAPRRGQSRSAPSRMMRLASIPLHLVLGGSERRSSPRPPHPLGTRGRAGKAPVDEWSRLCLRRGFRAAFSIRPVIGRETADGIRGRRIPGEKKGLAATAPRSRARGRSQLRHGSGIQARPRKAEKPRGVAPDLLERTPLSPSRSEARGGYGRRGHGKTRPSGADHDESPPPSHPLHALGNSA